MLVFVGLGYSLRHLTTEAIEALKTADIVYVDSYTSLYEDDFDKLREFNPNASFHIARRNDLEGKNVSRILEEALQRKVVIAVPGDPFIATTHDAIRLEAINKGIEVRVVNGLSIVGLAHSRLGLQSYKFGKTITLVYPDSFKPYSVVETIHDNLSRGLHTLILLDLRVEEGRAMTIPEAVNILLSLDEKGELATKLAVGAARLGWRTEKIVVARLAKLKEFSYPPPPHSIIVCGKLHPVEEEVLLKSNLQYHHVR